MAAVTTSAPIHPAVAAAKRRLDVALSAPALVLMVPCLPFLALATRLGRPGPRVVRTPRLLPGLWSVLRGEMSLVGPRPCVPYEFEDYQPWQKERLNALPGLTGLWQVSGKNRLSFEQMIHLDIRYTREKSLWMDLRCIVMTIPALVIQVMDTRRAQRQADKASAATIPLEQAVGAEIINRNARRELVRFRFPAETSAAGE
jgi:lipopolysaccharide/colanic/teichoic acid biosynthesis glycosyltransferase